VKPEQSAGILTTAEFLIGFVKLLQVTPVTLLVRLQVKYSRKGIMSADDPVVEK